MVILSPAFKNRMMSIHGQTGQDWLDNLPRLQADLIERWSLKDIQPLHDLSYNYLVFGITSDNIRVVLKMGVPHPELDAEIKALIAFDGPGSVHLLEYDTSLGALLLERILPGKDLRTIPDDQETTRIAARLMRQIWKPAPLNNNFPSAAGWCQGFQRYIEKYNKNGPLPKNLVEQAASLAKELLASSETVNLLHGDLHHMNILRKGPQTWIAIDPKGVLGEPAFEVGALLLNPVPDLIDWPALKNVQEQRLSILEEELTIDRCRLAGWSYVRAVLSAIWSVEDGEDWRYGNKVASVLRELI
jgi:streptomycin 6-kinase